MSILKWSWVNFTQCFADSLLAHNSPTSHYWRGAALQHLQFPMTAVTRSGYTVPGGGDLEGGFPILIPTPGWGSILTSKMRYPLIQLNEKLSFLAIKKCFCT